MHIPSYSGDTPNTFNPFGYLIRKGIATPGEIATEIEANGIYGWDRFNRFKHFGKGTPEALEALDLMAAGLARNTELDIQGDQESTRWPFEDYPTREDLYGWTDLDMPKFVKVDEPPVNKASVTKYANSEAKLLAAFMAVGNFDIDGINRVSEAKRYLEESGLSMDEKTIRATLDRARKILRDKNNRA